MPRTATTWVPGQSGNPGGRPGISREVRNLAQADTPAAYAKVKKLMDEANKCSTQLAAALAILKMAGVQMTADESGAPPPPSRPLTLETGKLLSLKSVSTTLPSPPSSGGEES